MKETRILMLLNGSCQSLNLSDKIAESFVRSQVLQICLCKSFSVLLEDSEPQRRHHVLRAHW